MANDLNSVKIRSARLSSRRSPRRRCIAAAEAVIAERGVDGFSLRETARRAGVSPAAPAHHFGDARGLLTALAAARLPGFRRCARGGGGGARTGRADPGAGPRLCPLRARRAGPVRPDVAPACSTATIPISPPRRRRAFRSWTGAARGAAERAADGRRPRDGAVDRLPGRWSTASPAWRSTARSATEEGAAERAAETLLPTGARSSSALSACRPRLLYQTRKGEGRAWRGRRPSVERLCGRCEARPAGHLRLDARHRLRMVRFLHLRDARRRSSASNSSRPTSETAQLPARPRQLRGRLRRAAARRDPVRLSRRQAGAQIYLPRHHHPDGRRHRRGRPAARPMPQIGMAAPVLLVFLPGAAGAGAGRRIWRRGDLRRRACAAQQARLLHQLHPGRA